MLRSMSYRGRRFRTRLGLEKKISLNKRRDIATLSILRCGATIIADKQDLRARKLLGNFSVEESIGDKLARQAVADDLRIRQVHSVELRLWRPTVSLASILETVCHEPYGVACIPVTSQTRDKG
jgi:hypothetical protein